MLLSLLILLLSAKAVHGQGGGNRAGLVIVHDDGRVVTRCVAFDEPQISGQALLQRSGVDFSSAAGPMGMTLCRLDGEGCPASDCWCQCKGSPCAYWNYYHGSRDGSWAYANAGASMRQVGDGDMDAWVWGDGSQPPPPLGFEAVCTASGSGDGTTSSPESPPATVTPTPPDTMEVAPTATSSPPPTSTPSVVAPTPTATAFETAPRTEATSTSEPLPTTTRTPFSEPSATPSPDVTEAAEPTRSAAPLTTPTEEAPADHPSEAQGPPQGYVAFAVLLAVIVGLFFILRRAQGT